MKTVDEIITAVNEFDIRITELEMKMSDEIRNLKKILEDKYNDLENAITDYGELYRLDDYSLDFRWVKAKKVLGEGYEILHTEPLQTDRGTALYFLLMIKEFDLLIESLSKL